MFSGTVVVQLVSGHLGPEVDYVNKDQQSDEDRCESTAVAADLVSALERQSDGDSEKVLVMERVVEL